MHKTFKKKYIRTLGRREMIYFPEWKFGPVEAKVDTGAYTGSLHADKITEKINAEGKPYLCFKLKRDYYPFLAEDVFIQTENFERKTVKNSFGEGEVRYIIPVKIKIGRKIIRSKISLTDRSTMKFQILIGRRIIKNKFLLDIGKTHLNGKKLYVC
jgi:hypothetical protein